jgi:hypothetical protein
MKITEWILLHTLQVGERSLLQDSDCTQANYTHAHSLTHLLTQHTMHIPSTHTSHIQIQTYTPTRHRTHTYPAYKDQIYTHYTHNT